MNWYKKSQKKTVDTEKESNSLDNGSPMVVWSEQPRSEKRIINLYRGFYADLEKMKNSDGTITLSPHRSEQGFLWFTHDLMGSIKAKEYVANRGNYILTYPLEVTRHYKSIHLSDGSVTEDIPEKIKALSNPLENCRFYLGYELPDGFYFSYKDEKFIVCNKPLIVREEMIQTNREFILENELEL